MRYLRNPREKSKKQRYPLNLWDEDVDNLFQELSMVFDDLFAPPSLKCMSSIPTIDFYRRDGFIVAEIELPGIDPGDIDLKVYKDRMILKAVKSQETDHDEDLFLCSERYFGNISRVIQFPAEVDPETARASFRNGVLRIEVKEIAVSDTGRSIDIELD